MSSIFFDGRCHPEECYPERQRLKGLKRPAWFYFQDAMFLLTVGRFWRIMLFLQLSFFMLSGSFMLTIGASLLFRKKKNMRIAAPISHGVFGGYFEKKTQKLKSPLQANNLNANDSQGNFEDFSQTPRFFVLILGVSSWRSEGEVQNPQQNSQVRD